MKQKTKTFTFLFFLTGLIIFIIIFKHLKKNETGIERLKWETKALHQKFSYTAENKENIKIQISGHKIILTKNKKAFSFNGIMLKKGEKFTKTIKKRGKYFLYFFVFQSKHKTKKGKLLFTHIRKGKQIKSLLIEENNELLPIKYNIELSYNDKIEIINKGDFFVLISNLIFLPKKTKPQYVFLIGVDTLRRDSIGTYNQKHGATPNIDEFSKDSVVFENAFASSPWTLPSFASVFTGTNPDTHLCNYPSDRLPEKLPTLFEILKEKFITIGFTGDYFLYTKKGFSRGFDLYEETQNDGIKRDAAKELFDQAIKAIRILGKENNFLLFLHTYQIHNPYFPEISLAEKYYKERYNNRYNLFYFNPIQFIKGGKEIGKSVADNKREEIRAVYNAGVYTFDYRFGKFINFLKKERIYNKSLIILFSDHGEEFEDHGCWEHGHSLYNELIRIPLIIKLPKNKKKGLKVKYNVSLIDIYPFLISYFKKNIPKTVEGKDLFLPQKNRIIESFLYPFAIRKKIPGKIALIKDKYKIIYSQQLNAEQKAFFVYPPKYKKFEFYNILLDPKEKENILKYSNKTVQEFIKILRTKKFKKKKRKEDKDIKKRLKTIGYL